MSHALLHAWEKIVRRRGDVRAIVQAIDGRSLTFRELDVRAEAWLGAQQLDMNALRARAVVFALPNGLGWFEVFLGLLKAGAIVVPLDAAEPLEAQQRFASTLRAGAWWDGTKLVPLAGAKRWRDRSLCLIKLTSGTTGQPRTLAFRAAQLLADGRQVTTTMGIGARDLNYALIPFGHSYGLGNLTIPLLAQGVPLVVGSAALPHAIAEDFARWKPTVFPGVPTLWRALAGSAVKLESLRRAISAGSPLAPEVAAEFAARFGQRLHSFYGSSETGGIAYDVTGRAALEGEVGRALRGVKLRALAGQRLLVSSAAVLTHGNRRKWGNLGAWIMSDRVMMDPRGGLALLGRRGATVKIAGRRVNLVEVTERLKRLAGVREVWVGVGGGNESVLGAVIATERTVADLRAALHGDTAAWKIPKRWKVVAALPLTARGKIDSRALQAMVF